MTDVYDYLFENDLRKCISFCDEFPATGLDEEEGAIYLARVAGAPIYKITIERV